MVALRLKGFTRVLGSFGPIHWIIVLVMLATYLVPVAQILRRTGFSGWLCVLAMIPVVNLVLFWVCVRALASR